MATMKLFLTTILLLLPENVIALLINKNLQEFKVCYDEYVGSNAVPRTTAQLADVISKIEKFLHDKSANIKPDQLALHLLYRFRHDGINVGPYKLKVKPEIGEEQRRIFELIPHTAYDVNAIDMAINKSLTKAEFCSMHLMLSHNVDNHHPSPSSHNNVKRSEISETSSDSHIQHSPKKSNPKPPEYGTLYNEYGTLVGGTLMNGLASGLSSKESVRVLGIQFDPVYATTIAGELGKVIVKHYDDGNGNANNVNEFFGPAGTWTGSNCPTNYILYEPASVCTTAQFIGAVDGIILGLKAKELQSKGYRLSTMIRWYYGSKGSQSRNPAACKRWEFMRKENTKMNTEIINMVKYLDKLDKFNHMNDDEVTKSLDEVITYVNPTFILELKGNTKCPTAPTVNTPVCVTDAEISTILGFASVPKFNNLTSNLLSRIQTNGSTIGVYTNIIPKYGLHALSPLDESGTKFNAVCAAERFQEPREGKVFHHTLEGTIDSAKKFYSTRKIRTKEYPYVPAQIAIIVNDEALSKLNVAREALKSFEDYLPEVKLFLMGSHMTSLKPRSNDVFPLTENAVDDVLKKVCQIPSTLQYFHCYSKSSSKEKEFVHTGEIAPNTIKYMSVLQDTFMTSSRVSITFELVEPSSKIRIYQDRGDVVSTSSKNRTELNIKNRKYSFVIDNPCRTYEEDNCAPIAFAIVGVNCTVPKSYCCKDFDHCSFPDNIPFKVTHEGFYCGNGWNLVSSPFAFLLTFLVIFVNQKCV